MSAGDPHWDSWSHSRVRASSAATPTERAIATIMATLAELELELAAHERRAASRESRRIRGLAATKPPKLSPEGQRSSGAWPRPASPCTSWPKRSGSDEQPRTATCPSSPTAPVPKTSNRHGHQFLDLTAERSITKSSAAQGRKPLVDFGDHLA